MGRAFLTIRYDETKQETYKCMELSLLDKDKMILFDSGDPLIDWYDYKKFFYNGDALKEDIFVISHSSNVDHWFMDGDKYLEKLFHLETGEFLTQDEINKCGFSDLDKYPTCVVTADMKNFQDLKDYYKKNKKEDK